MMSTVVVVLQGLLLSHVAFSQSSKDPVVVTSKGVVQGLWVDHSNTTGAKFCAFLGIPYADKPVRFKIAQPKTRWEGVLIAHKDSPACPQPTKTPSSEDCLHLNVFMPQGTTPTSLLPVMVYIHGSAYTYSSSYSVKYGPDFLVSRDVILVAFNYRLGVLGFLTLGSSAATGNLGLHDSLLALRWVREEISNFGGDPTRITLFGQSAGAAMTYFHYLSPLSAGKGLFQQAITQSGSALMPGASYSRAEGARRGYQLAQMVGCNVALDDQHIVECLRAVDLQTLVNHTYIPIKDLVTGFFPFVPVLDDASWSDSPFFNDSLENLIGKAVSRSIPLVSGFNTQDGSLAIDATERWEKAENNLISFIPESERKELTEDDQNCLTIDIKNHYFSDPSDNKIPDIINLFTKYFVAFPNFELALRFKEFTYVYVFGYNGSWIIPNIYFSQLNIKGIVAHGAELPYLFAGKAKQKFDFTKENIPNLKVKDIMAEMWTNFAKTGDPGYDWEPLSKGEVFFIESTPSKLSVEKAKSLYYDFWHNILKKASSGRHTSCIVI